MVYRVYVEKKSELANEAASLLGEIKNLLQIDGVTGVRIFNRYDVENIDKKLFDYAVSTVFSEPQLDIVTYDYEKDGSVDFAVEYLPGQFDQRADSAAQCIQIISCGERPTIRTAKVYVSVYDKSRSKEVLKGLKSAGGFLRRHIGTQLQLRYTPELVFVEDHAIEHGMKIFDILSKLDIPEDDGNDEGADE